MKPSLGPRYGGRGASLAALTVGLRGPELQMQEAFIPFEHLSAGEKYSLSFALASSRIPGESFPIILMEEPETALCPSAIAKIVGKLQSSSSGDAPQVIMASHSESVLRRFSVQDVFIMGSDRQPIALAKAIKKSAASPPVTFAAEQLIMPGGPAALFADKILLVEGADDAIVSGYLDRLPAKLSAESGGGQRSFSASGWCVLGVEGARNVPQSVQILSSLKKEVAALLDGDGEGKKYSEITMRLCPTFRYRSDTEGNPTLEDALLFGLPKKERENALDEFYQLPECQGCTHQNGTPKCWKRNKVKNDRCPRDWRQRKTDLQRACLALYRTGVLFPPAFELLLEQLDSAKSGSVTELRIEPRC